MLRYWLITVLLFSSVVPSRAHALLTLEVYYRHLPFNLNSGEFLDINVVNPCAGDAVITFEGFRLQEASPQGGAAFLREARLTEGQAAFHRYFGPHGVSELTKVFVTAQLTCEAAAIIPSRPISMDPKALPPGRDASCSPPFSLEVVHAVSGSSRLIPRAYESVHSSDNSAGFGQAYCRVR